MTESVPLTDFCHGVPDWQNSGVTVPAEGGLGVMHHAAVIVPYSQSVHFPGSQLFEIVSFV